MLEKNYSKTGKTCKVRFSLPKDVQAGTAHLLGEFNGWNETATPMTKSKDGEFAVTISLQPGRAYRFRYLLDGIRWENDWEADRYVINEFGTEDSVVEL